MEIPAESQPRPVPESPVGLADAPRESSFSPHPERFRIRDTAEMVAALCLAGLVLGYLLVAPSGKAAPQPGANRPAANESVKLVGERLLQIQAGHVIEQKLQIATIERRRINVPILTV